jgi:hypothetical protein
MVTIVEQYLIPSTDHQAVHRIDLVVFTYRDGFPKEYVGVTLWHGALEVADPATY